MDPTLIAAFAIVAAPAVLVLATLTVLGSFIAALAEGRFSIVRPPQS